MGFSLQHKSIEELSSLLKIEHGQILALYNKAVKRLTNCVRKDMKKDVENSLGFANNIQESIPLNPNTEEIIGDLSRNKKIKK